MHESDIPPLLHGLHAFLLDDLGPLLLPPAVEYKRRSLLGQIIRVCKCTTTSGILSSEATVVGHIPALPTCQSRPLSVAACAFTDSSISLWNNNRSSLCSHPQQHNPTEAGTKRYSLPPGGMSWIPTPIISPTAISHWSADSERYSRANTEPPLPPKSGRRNPVVATTNSEYEVPRALVSVQDNSAFRRCTGEAFTPGVSHSSMVLTSPAKSVVNRLSLSPQPEGLSHCSTTPAPELQSAITSSGTLVNGYHRSAGTGECQDDATHLTLPKKSLTNQSRRSSAYMDCGWTLVGSLHHRVKPNKWVRLPCCFLTTGSRLVAHKSLSAANLSSSSPASTAPSLVLFLCGASAVYAGRDSGMEHVIKVAHPSWGTCALASETEEHAVVWIRQINQYAQGITPTETLSFLDHPGIVPPTSSIRCSNQAASASRSAPIVNVGGQTNTVVDLVDSHRNSVTELQEDSGFSAPISSGSEGNSADGMVHRNSVITTESSSGPVIDPTLYQICGNAISHIDATSRTSIPLPPTTMANYTPPEDVLMKRSFRRESLLSSMRRKVESFSSKRRARKSLPQSFQLATTTVSTVLQSHRLSKASSTIEITHHRQSTVNQVQSRCTGSRNDTTSTITTAQHVSSVGFGWAQLDSAATLIGRTSAGNYHLTTAFLPGQPNVPKKMAKQRPQSAIIDHLWYQQQVLPPDVTGNSRDALLGDSVSPVTAGPTTSSRIIVAGETQISIPGRLPWTNLWCCLRSHCLDIYALANQPKNNHRDVLRDTASMSETSWPLFSLPLEPGQVEFGLAGDKRRKSALRLAAPRQSTTAILFDIPGDKVRMGSWIRGFIQALGIIPTVNKETDAAPKLQNEYLHECTSPTPKFAPSSYDYDCSVDSASHAEYSGSRSSNAFNTALNGCEVSVRLGDVTEEEECGEPSTVAKSAGHNTNGNLYDEVCPSAIKSHLITSGASFKRHWSSPVLFPTVSSTASSYQSGLQHTSCFSPTNQQTPQKIVSTANQQLIMPHGSWYIPPPSRRLLSQPLPPLPSVGPSATESLAGTIVSSRGGTSTSLTPDDGVDDGRSSVSPNPTALDDLFIGWPDGSLGIEQPNQWSPGIRYDNPTGVHHRVSGNRRRHSSLSVPSAEDQPITEPPTYEPHRLQHYYSVPPASTNFNEAPSQRQQDYDYIVPGCHQQGQTDCTAVLLSSANTSTIGGADDTVGGGSSVATTHVVSGGCYCYSSNVSLVHSSDPEHGICWVSSIPAMRNPDTDSAMTAAWVLPHAVNAARRSVSCITGSKPMTVVPVSREIATLPTRCTSYGYQSGVHRYMVAGPRIPNVPTTKTTSFSSSTCSHTATSGASSTPGHFSSSSSVSTSLGLTADCTGSTRPSSLVIVAPLTEEEDVTEAVCSSLPSVLVTTEAGGLITPCSSESASKVSEQQDKTAATLPAGSCEQNILIELASHQLEEVHHEVEKLRRRRKTLSFRLYRQLGSSSGQLTSPLVNGAGDEDNIAPTDAVAHQPSAHCRAIQSSNPEIKDGHLEQEVDSTAAITTTICPTTSLCARLAMVEAMLNQAEQTETRLLQDLSRWTITEAVASGSGDSRHNEGDRESASGFATKEAFYTSSATNDDTLSLDPNMIVHACHQDPSSIFRVSNGHASHSDSVVSHGGPLPTHHRRGRHVASSSSAPQQCPTSVYPPEPTLQRGGTGGASNRPRRGNRGFRWHHHQPGSSTGWHRSGYSRPAAVSPRRWRSRNQYYNKGFPLTTAATACSSPQHY